MFAARLHVALEFERGVIDPQFAEPCAERLLQLRHPLQIVYRYVRRQGVLSAQTWRWCTPLTPGCDATVRKTSS